MFSLIKENIKGFVDVTVLVTMTAIGIFAILVDYRYFKRLKFRKDALSALGVGIAFILLPFVLYCIGKL